MKKWKWMAVLLGLALAFGIPTAQAEVQVKPIEHMRADFIKGADVSMLHDLEKNGAKFYDTDGQEMDNLAIMKKHGVNWIRLRVWNHPSQGGGAGMGGYSVSPQGQADAIRDVMQAVANVPDGRGLGVFYWEPDWIVVPGCGAGGGWGNGWENLAMFDKNGKALESWKVFEVK